VDAAVSEVKIGTGAVTGSKIGTGAVDSGKILDDTIQEIDMSAPYKRGIASGVCPLDAAGLVPAIHLPPLSIVDVTVCADIPCRDALTPQSGDVCKVLDRGDGLPETFIWDSSSWIQIMDTSDVTSVNGQTGVVTLTTTEINEGTNLYYTETRVDNNANVATNTLHSATTTGNPHDLSLNDLSDVSATTPALGQTIAWDGISSWVLNTPTASGEANTASNLGTGGKGLFSNKNGVDLEFYSIIEGSNKIIIETPSGGNVALDVNETNIIHNNLEGVDPNEHVDHSSIILSGVNGITVSGTGDLTAPRSITFDASMSQISDVANTILPSVGDILEYTVGGWNTGNKRGASNIGTGAGNVFKQIASNNMEFRTLVDAGSGRVSITTLTDTLSIDVQEGSVQHDNLAGFVANEHVDHASVILTGVNGITVSGTGDLTASRSITADTTVLQARVTGTCSSGQAIREIDVAGGVTCETTGGGSGSLTFEEATATNTVALTTVSSTHSLIPSMSVSLTSVGNWMCTYSASMSADRTDEDLTYALFSGGTLITHSDRRFAYNGGGLANDMEFSGHTQAIINVASAPTTIEAKWRKITGNSNRQFRMNARSLQCVQLS
jgi:hypothetical protein